MFLDILYLIGAFLLSLFIGYLCIPRIVWMSKSHRLFDGVEDRKAHIGNIPRLGGLSFFPAIMTSFLFFGGLLWSFRGEYLPSAAVQELLFFGSGLIIIYCMGVWDDIAQMQWHFKFILQCMAAALIVCAGPCLYDYSGVLGIGEISEFASRTFTLFLIVAVINAYNLIDGVDGLCSGLSMLALTTYIIVFGLVGQWMWALLAACALGATVALFRFNVFSVKFKIFMGDGGSLTLGYIIAFLGVKLITLPTAQTTVIGGVTPMVLVGLLFIPLFDMLRLFIRRIVRGHSPFDADREHIHHKFLDLGFTHIQSTLWIVGIQAVYTALNFVLENYVNLNILLAIDLLSGFLLLAVLQKLIDARQKKG